MNWTLAEADLDFSFTDDSLAMNVSGVGLPSLSFFSPGFPETSIKPSFGDVELDFAFPDDIPGIATSEFRFSRTKSFSEGKTLSSLAAVVFLHVLLVCVLFLSANAAPQAPKAIEVQLVSLCEDAGSAGNQSLEKGMNAGGGARATAPEPRIAPVSASAPVEKKGSISTPAAVEIPPPKRKTHIPPRPRPARVAKVTPKTALHEEVQTVRRADPPQTASGAAQPKVSPEKGAVAGNTAGVGEAATHGGNPGAVKGAGGSGGSDIGFGSPNGPKFLHQAMPFYPVIAKRLERQGTVLLRVTIDERGMPIKIEIIRKAGFGFDEEAMRAVKSSTFIPAKRAGQPLTCKALLPIRFVLN